MTSRRDLGSLHALLVEPSAMQARIIRKACDDVGLLHVDGVGSVADAVYDPVDYGAAQALPGPLFSFAAFLGAASTTAASPIAGSLIALLAVFLPGLLLVAGVLPLWASIRTHGWMNRLTAGAGATMVGILAAALYRPVLTSAVLSPVDALIAATGLAALLARTPVWMVVAGVALAGGYFSAG